MFKKSEVITWQKNSEQQSTAKLKQLSDDNNVISAIAIDQRGSLKKMLQADGNVKDVDAACSDFKTLVAEELTPYGSAILLDPEYGLPASKARDKDCGLLLAYEETGYDASVPGRLPHLLPNLSAKRIKENDAVL